MTKRKRAVTDVTPGALHSTSRSGYARVVAPERVGTDALERTGVTIPVASKSGRQEGLPTPAERVYKQGVHEVIDAEEAMRRLAARQRGVMRPIVGGLDDMKKARAPKTAAWQPVDDRQPYAEEPVDPVGELDSFEPGQGDDQDEPAAERSAPTRPVQQARPNPFEAYWRTRKRITLELAETTLNIAAIDLIVNRYSVTIILPQTDDGGTFIPKPGSELTISTGETSIACYFPGSHFEIPQLKLMGLSFIRKEEGS